MTTPDPERASAVRQRDGDEAVRRMATESLASDDPTGWFERLYAAAADGAALVPWDRGAPHPLLIDWAAGRPVANGTALVVGCGPGFDAEFVAGLGLRTTAFDVSPTAVEAARQRFPGSPVHYVAADLLAPPAEWRQAFDLVVEIMTVQSLPVPLHPQATAEVTRFVAPGGTLLVIASARADGVDAPAAGPPWPLTRAEVDAFAGDGLVAVSVEEDASVPPMRRWRAEFRR